MRRATDFSPIFPVDRGVNRCLYGRGKSCSRHGRGFTLIEMIISIVITGIVVSMMAMFGRNQVNAYIDVSNRAELSDAADTALRRIARDLQSALPNSVRNASASLLEFVPIHDAGRYRAELSSTGTGNVLDFGSSADSSFDVLGPAVTVVAGDQLVIFNLGQPGSDVYEAASSRRAVTAGAGLSTVTFAPGGTQFPLASPSNRFQIVGTPVTYECSGNRLLRRSGYGFQPAQPISFAALGGSVSVLAENVTNCTFSYTPAVLQRNGLVVLRLSLSKNGETVELLHQVAVLNTP
jgi:MSHA biogenesis protein MshO